MPYFDNENKIFSLRSLHGQFKSLALISKNEVLTGFTNNFF